MRIRGVFLVLLSLYMLSSCTNTYKIQNKKVEKELSKDHEQQYYYIFLEANRKKLLGDINSALALFYQCLEINPNSAVAMAEISKIHEIIQNYDTAIKYAKSAVDKDPKNKWYSLNLAKLYIVKEDYNQAQIVYETIYLHHKDDIEIAQNLAELYIQNSQYQDAITIYNDIEKQYGISENISLRKQQLYYKTGQTLKAYEEIDKLIKYFPNETRYYGIMAEMYTNDNLFLKAEEYYNKLFELDSINESGQLSKIDFYRKKLDYDNVFRMINRVIKNKNIDFDQKVMVFVSILNNQKEFNLYNQQIKKELDILKLMYPQQIDSYTLNADYYVKMNKLNEAKDELICITDNFSANIYLWEQLLSIYSYKTDFEGLYHKSITAIDSFPNHALFYLFNGISANQTNRNESAVVILEKGLNKAKNDEKIKIDFYTYLGEAYHNIKDYKNSDYYFKLAIQNNPDDLSILNNYSYYLSLREENLEYAESLSKRTIEAEPKNSTFLDTYAWILYKLERYEDAKYYIQKAIDNGGVDSDVIVEHFGDILYKNGEIDRALELWKLSKQMGNTSKELENKINKEVELE